MKKDIVFIKIFLIIASTPLFFVSSLWLFTLGGFNFMECIHSVYMLAITTVFVATGIGVAAQTVTEEE